MNEEIKKEWIEALRSGEYEQGRGKLTIRRADGDKDCCLGVLCKIAKKHGIISTEIVVNASDFPSQTMIGDLQELQIHESCGIVFYDDNSYVLPSKVVEWAELSRPNPLICSGPPGAEPRVLDLSFFNDEPGSNFEQIADLIENQL